MQPGPAALTEGVRQIHAIIAHVIGEDVDASIAPAEKTYVVIIPGIYGNTA